MTDDTATTDTPTQAAETPATAPDGTAGDNHQQRRDEARREALRAAQDRVQQLESRLQARDRRDAERAAASVLQDPGDLWQSTDLSDLYNEDGDLDAEKVTAAAQRIVQAKPHYQRRARVSDAGIHAGGDGPQAPMTWGDLLTGRDRSGRR